MMAIMAAFLPFLFEQNYTTNRPPLATFLRIGRISLRYGPVSEQDKDKEKDNDKDKDKDIYILSLRERAPGGEREKYICPPWGIWMSLCAGKPQRPSCEEVGNGV
jgi:hypothetical protein